MTITAPEVYLSVVCTAGRSPVDSWLPTTASWRTARCTGARLTSLKPSLQCPMKCMSISHAHVYLAILGARNIASINMQRTAGSTWYARRPATVWILGCLCFDWQS